MTETGALVTISDTGPRMPYRSQEEEHDAECGAAKERLQRRIAAQLDETGPSSKRPRTTGSWIAARFGMRSDGISLSPMALTTLQWKLPTAGLMTLTRNRLPDTGRYTDVYGRATGRACYPDAFARVKAYKEEVASAHRPGIGTWREEILGRRTGSKRRWIGTHIFRDPLPTRRLDEWLHSLRNRKPIV